MQVSGKLSNADIFYRQVIVSIPLLLFSLFAYKNSMGVTDIVMIITAMGTLLGLDKTPVTVSVPEPPAVDENPSVDQDSNKQN